MCVRNPFIVFVRRVVTAFEVLFFIYSSGNEKIFPDIEKMRSTAAAKALTERYYFAKPAKNGKVLLCCFQNFIFPFLNG